MTSIPTIELGVPGNKVRVPRIGFGAMSLSIDISLANDEEYVKVLARSVDIGCTFWNSSNIYGMGLNEKLLSRVLRNNRDKVFVSTKFGITFREPEEYPPKLFTHYVIGFNGKRDYVHESVDQALERLGTDYIDMYTIGRIDRSTPLEETIGAMAELVKEGKIRYIGISECTADDLRRAHKVHPIAAVEVEYSASTRDIERDGLLDACRELGVTVIAYSPLGRGFLGGKIRSVDDLGKNDPRHVFDRYQQENIEANIGFIDRLESLAKKYNATVAQLALVWLLNQEPNLIAIPGTKQIKYLEENFSAGQIKLSDAELKELRDIVDNANIQGHRLLKGAAH